MPYEWSFEEGAPGPSGAPSRVRVLSLWPHRSMTHRGLVAFMGISVGLALVPMIAVLGTPVLWAVLPFFVATFGLTFAMRRRSTRDGDLVEELRLVRKVIRLDRREPDGTRLGWEANPHWVRVTAHEDGPVEHYLTLQGGPREVEIGAFLTAPERETLERELARALADLRP